MKSNSANKIRKLTVTAILGAVATVLMFLEFSVPFVPSFIKMDLSDFPALIAAFALGPLSGVGVCLIKNLINLLVTYSGGIGELANFLLGCALVIPAGLVYKYTKTRGGAVIGSFVGAASMAILSLPINYFIVYPAYAELLMPMDVIIAAYQAILPRVTTLWQALLIFNVPFTLVKGILCTIVTFILYKPLSPILKGKYRA